MRLVSRRAAWDGGQHGSRVAAALVVAALLAVIGGVGWAYAEYRADTQAQARGAESPNFEPPTEPPVMLVIGDSFTAGTEYNTGDEWGERVASSMGWYFFKDAVGGTGYVSGSDIARRFGARIGADIRDYRPDVVLIAGGRNDLEYPVNRVKQAAASVVGRAKAGFGKGARVVLVSPFASGAPDAATRALTTALREVADARGVDYLDLSKALSASPTYIAADRVHPTDAGQAALAAEAKEALVALGFEPFAD